MSQESASAFHTQDHAEDPEALLRDADARRGEGRWAEAAGLYRRVVGLWPESWALMVQEGHCLKESGRVQEALARYRDAENLAPDDADLQLQIGHAHKLLGEWQNAALAYARAVSLDPGNADAWREASATAEWLVRQAPAQAPDDELPPLEGFPTPSPIALSPSDDRPEPAPRRDNAAVLQMVLDVTDLLDYFNNARTPTGIQRVQMGIVSRAMAEPSHPELELCFAAYDPADLAWHEVDSAGFNHLTYLATIGSDTEDPSWVMARDSLRQLAANSPGFAFRQDALLVNLGNSWGFPDYFRALRAVQHSHGVRYIPFIHDCVPLVVPEHCLLSMVQDYSRWFAAVGLHAHGILCNSENTMRDVRQHLNALLPDLDLPGHVIRLDADPRSVAVPSGDPGLAALRALRHGERFVLFVATIESRKDHLLVFQAWLQLLRRHGPLKVPRLVCVGKAGWHSEAALNLLHNAPELQRHVVLLSRISDQELGALYSRCLFTVYNSHYEGWGLPITEALAHGKVVLTAQHSALTEAGGEAAIYFTPQSQPDLQQKLEHLIFNDEARHEQEAVVREKGRPRSWSAVKNQTLTAVLDLARRPARPLAERRAIRFGQRYETRRFLRNRPDMAVALAESVRDGLCWHPAEEWGVWCRGGTATLRIPLPAAPEGSALRLYLELRAPPVAITLPVRCSSADGPALIYELPLEATTDRTFMLDLPPLGSASLLEIELENGNGVDLGALGLPDPRRLGVGLRGFMICRLDDHAARLDFLEQQGFYQATLP
ncbi:glycosyltransferase [Teichococcus oryzae]|uniref:Glycosyltransferase n=1 Tax=Teichococcus oryzae TaxID=1608942 RepID=A0A5B2TLN9_9PROT|nr:glycosyltransferase [Pseudoroseomonas oryzae]KAA2215119.1 glycosyltransferase [Pseudoroseomonas oryzae]